MIDPLINFFSAMLHVFSSLPQPFVAFVSLSFFLSFILVILKLWKVL